MRTGSHSTLRNFLFALAGVALVVQLQGTGEAPSAEATPQSVQAESETGITQEAWNKTRHYSQMGDSARHQQDWERADELYTEALSHAWWHPIFNNRGWVRCMKGEYAEGLSDADKAISMGSKPEDLKHYYHTRATALHGLGKVEEALEAVEKSLQYDKNFVDSLNLKTELERLI